MRKPGTRGSHGSAQGVLDVSNLCRLGKEKDEEDVLHVPCMA